MIEVKGVDDVLEVVRTFQQAPENVSQQMRLKGAAVADAEWIPGLQSRAITSLEQAVIASSASVDMTDTSLRAFAAESTTPLSGGLVPDSQWGGAEHGSSVRVITVTRLGKERQQRTGRQFQPFNRSGYVARPTARRMGPLVVAAWIRGAVKGMTMGNPHMETR